MSSVMTCKAVTRKKLYVTWEKEFHNPVANQIEIACQCAAILSERKKYTTYMIRARSWQVETKTCLHASSRDGGGNRTTFVDTPRVKKKITYRNWCGSLGASRPQGRADACPWSVSDWVNWSQTRATLTAERQYQSIFADNLWTLYNRSMVSSSIDCILVSFRHRTFFP